MKNKKLLIVGGGVIHAYNLIKLIKGYFDEVSTQNIIKAKDFGSKEKNRVFFNSIFNKEFAYEK